MDDKDFRDFIKLLIVVFGIIFAFAVLKMLDNAGKEGYMETCLNHNHTPAECTTAWNTNHKE